MYIERDDTGSYVGVNEGHFILDHNLKLVCEPETGLLDHVFAYNKRMIQSTNT